MTKARRIWRALRGGEDALGRRHDCRLQHEQQPGAPAARAGQERGRDLLVEADRLLAELRAHRAEVDARLVPIEALLAELKPPPPGLSLGALLDRMRRGTPTEVTWWVNQDFGAKP